MAWKIIKKVDVFSNKFLSLTEKQSKHPHLGNHNFYCIEFPHWVNVVPITKNNELIIVKQYRHGLEEYTLETPGGVVDPGETPLSTAQRELLEETGYIGDFTSLGKVAANPAIQGNFCHMYMVQNCVKASKQNLDPTEEIDIMLVPLNDVVSYINSEKIVHSLSVVSILKAMNQIEKR